MRCFIGVPLPGGVRKSLAGAQNVFSKVDARMTIVDEHNLHVTLNFLDEVDNIDKINESLSNISFKPFKASIKNISYFPNQGYIRVIHSPVVEGSKEFKDLYSKIVSALSLESEENFVPHVTLARVKFVKSTNALARACNGININESFDVNCFNLYKSELTPKGPVYQVINSYPKVFK